MITTIVRVRYRRGHDLPRVLDHRSSELILERI